MATKKDLVEAHAFSRRRLVTAFVSGAPGGREVEPARPGRVIIGGLALSVLLIAGAAIAGIFVGKAPEDWAQPGLFISKTTGAAYVITEDADPAVLRPVANITSAKLILGAGTEPTMMAQDAINNERVGEEIGILFAPAAPPTSAELLNTGWTACTASNQGIRLTLATAPGATDTPSAGMVVRAGARYFLLARASDTMAAKTGSFAYELPRNAGVRDNMLSELGLRSSSYAATVSERFLSLLPAGGALEFESMGVDGAGEGLSYAGGASGVPQEARVGDILTVPGGVSVVLTATGPADLSPFALAVYGNLNQGFVPQQLTTEQPLGAGRVRAPYADANWPDSGLVPTAGDPCLVLNAVAGSVPQVGLASDPSPEASARGVAGRRVSVRVEAGHGAYISSGNWDAASGGTPFMIDGTGKAFELEGDDTAERLDFGDVRAPVVPDTWVELFEAGVALSPDAALCPARPRDAGATSCE